MKIDRPHDTFGRWYDEEGILHVNLLDFLLDQGSV